MFIHYFIILALGFSVSYTDIKFKKIRNIHLLVAAAFGLASYAYLMTIQEMTFDINMAWNFLIGLGIGLLLYFTETWGAGDAKLFAVFCLLMPTQRYSQILPFPSVALFINIFLVGTVAILFLSMGQIIQNRKTILKKILSFSTLAILLKSFLTIFSLKWLIQDTVHRLMPQTTFFLSILILFFSYLIILRMIDRFQNNLILALILSLGLGLRFLFHPLDFNISALLSYVKMTFFYTFIFYCIYIIFDLNKPGDKRAETIPFAPLMFSGTLLTNTNLLNWVMQILSTVRK